MNGAVRIVLPLEITVRFAGSETPVVASLPAAAAAPAGPAPRRTLSSGPEARRPDSNYAGRPGYRPNFLPDHPLALPRPTAALAEQIAPLRAGEPAAETGELRYQHFSVVMHRLRRVALFTATNIDGASYLAIDRASGRPAAEGDTWYHDQRISRAFTLGQEFYSEWSDYFDRGHLTRRSDPTWGSPEEAMRANADTFHFTNCAPQHFRFNQAAKYWQGAERYVLENGLLATDAHAARLSVFQGPIFDERRDRWADDVQIPSAFFKVVVWRGRDRLRAVGLLVDQVALLDEPRRFLGTPRDLPAVEVGQWRTAIARIGDLSGLVFDPAILAADTIQRAGQPQVGAEAAVPLRSFDDLRDICA
jgi:endonuclease G